MADAIDLGIPGIGPATLLDRGGSAYVYLAEQEDFGRKVAVKVLFDALEDDATYKRFDRECRAIGAVSHHPNIAVVHGRGLTNDERPYLVMEYRAGGSLAQHLTVRGRMTEAEVINIGIKIGSALQVAHDAGVLHRDVKPANILLSAYNEPALADFGIARMDGTHKTTEGVFSASVVHASREILDSGNPTPRSDVYALASTLFELVTGSAAYADPEDLSVWAVVDRVLNQDPPDPTLHGVSDGLGAVLTKAMNHRPDERQATAAEFVAELEDLGRSPSSKMQTVTMPVSLDSVAGLPIDKVDLEADRISAASNRSGSSPSDGHVEPAKTAAVRKVRAKRKAVKQKASKEVGKEARKEAGKKASKQAEKQTGKKPRPPAPMSPDGNPQLSRTGLLIAVGIIAVGSVAIGLFTAAGAGGGNGVEGAAARPKAQLETTTIDGGTTSLEAVPRTVSNSDTTEGGKGADQTAIDHDQTDGGDEGPLSPADGGSSTIETESASFLPELRFPRAEIGPLQTDERYVLSVTGVPGDAEYRIIVDGRPVTRRESTTPVYFPKPGRHQLQVEVATDDRVELTEEVEIYVSGRTPTSGYRVNLSAIRSRPENWPDALRQFDQFVLDGHEGLEISLSDRLEGSALPYWNFYIYYGQDRDGAIAYCEDRGLSNNECYTAEVE